MEVTRKGYRTIAISLYDEDIARADQHVAALKARGYRRMGRSQLIRLALLVLDTTNLRPPEEVLSKIVSRPPTVADVIATQQASKPWSQAYQRDLEKLRASEEKAPLGVVEVGVRTCRRCGMMFHSDVVTSKGKRKILYCPGCRGGKGKRWPTATGPARGSGA